MIVEVLLLLTVVIYYIFTQCRKPAKLPPGTFGYPVVGYLIPRTKDGRESYIQQMYQKYGDIFTSKWGRDVNVFLAEPGLVKRALALPDLQERPKYALLRNIQEVPDTGILYADGECWRNNRRFLLFNLKNLGMGKTHLEHSMNDEIVKFVDYIEQNLVDQPKDMDYTINVLVLNIIWQMLASKRYDMDDDFISGYLTRMSEVNQLRQGNVITVHFFPWIQRLMTKAMFNRFTQLPKIIKTVKEMNSLFKKEIVAHQKTLDPEQPRDLIDHYLLTGREKDDTEHNDMIMLMNDLFLAGTETTSSTMKWVIKYLATHPEIQKKVHACLDAAVPRDRLPCLTDRLNLAYLEATVLDVLRLRSFLPFGLPHVALRNVNFEGHIIPKGATVYACIEHLHHNPKFWERPDELYPEHFLDSKGNLSLKNTAFMPFEIGKRSCIGEPLARMEILLIMASVFHRFRVENAPGETTSTDRDPTQFFLCVPPSFKVIFKKRF